MSAEDKEAGKPTVAALIVFLFVFVLIVACFSCVMSVLFGGV